MSQISAPVILGQRASVRLEPKVLRQAGVAFEDARWFSTMPRSAMVAALNTKRGKKIVDAVTSFLRQSSNPGMVLTT